MKATKALTDMFSEAYKNAEQSGSSVDKKEAVIGKAKEVASGIIEEMFNILKRDYGIAHGDMVKSMREIVEKGEQERIKKERLAAIKKVRSMCVEYRITATNLKGSLATRGQGSGYAKLDRSVAKAKALMAAGDTEKAAIYLDQIKRMKAAIKSGEMKQDDKKPTKKKGSTVETSTASVVEGTMKLDIPTMSQQVVK